MKVFIHEYGMSLLSMLMCIFLTVTASPVSTQIQGAMTDVVNQATNVANFDNLDIVDTSIGTYNDKKVLKAELSCSKSGSNEDLSGQKDLFTVTATYSDSTSGVIPTADIISINKVKEDEDGITYTATIKAQKNFNTNELTIGKITPIYAGYNSNNTTLYFANTEQEIKDADVDISGDNYYKDISTKCNYDSSYARPWNSQRSNITTVKFLSEIKPTSCSYWFDEFSKLTQIKNIENLNTKNCTNMYQMFNACNSLISLDLSNFNTSKVTYMSYMFDTCSALTSLDVSSFNTSKVTYMSNMFYNCSALTSLDVSNFDTSKVTDMSSMFKGCSSLTSLDVSSFNTSKVTYMSNMFYNCSALTSLDVSNFDTSKVTDMDSMFSGCSKLISLNVSNFDTSKVTSMGGMFYDCNALTSLDVSNFDTSEVASMGNMFSSCKALTLLDVSNFNTSKVGNMNYMFYNCSALTSLDVSSFNTSKVTYMNYMFSYCSKLTSLNLGNFDTSKVTYMNSMFYRMPNNSKIYTISQSTKDWILELSTSNRPSVWTTDNIVILCKNELGHKFETITTDATCTEDGKQVKTCIYCGYKEENIIKEKLGHDIKTSMDENGVTQRICSRCNKQQYYKIDITNNTNYTQDGNKFTSNIKGISSGKASIELTLTVYKTSSFDFKYKVSSESRYDKGSLIIDGTTVANAISGTSNGEQTYSKTLEPGTYTITSQYTKDVSGNKGDDCFYFIID